MRQAGATVRGRGMSRDEATSAREVAAVAATGAGHLVVAVWLQKQAVFIIGAAVFWTGFVLLRLRRDRGALRAWGFGAGGFVQSARILLPVAAVAALGMLGYAVARGSTLVAVGVGVSVLVGVLVGVGVEVFVGVIVGVSVGVLVGVSVGVAVGVSVEDGPYGPLTWIER